MTDDSGTLIEFSTPFQERSPSFWTMKLPGLKYDGSSRELSFEWRGMISRYVQWRGPARFRLNGSNYEDGAIDESSSDDEDGSDDDDDDGGGDGE